MVRKMMMTASKDFSPRRRTQMTSFAVR
ncbi:hypothetical protein ACHAWT_009726 [Skeletonema menzelii]